MLLIRFDEDYSQSLHNSYQGFERVTLTKHHSVFQSINLPTLCLLEVYEEDATTCCYLATATRKTAVSTFESRLSIEKLRIVFPTSLQDMKALISDARMLRLLEERLPDEGSITRLSPQLSAHLIEILAENPDN